MNHPCKLTVVVEAPESNAWVVTHTRAGAACGLQQLAHAKDKLGRTKGLTKKCLYPQRATLRLNVRLSRTRYYDNWQAGERSIGAQFLQCSEAVDVLHMHVKKGEIDRVFADDLQRFTSTAGGEQGGVNWPQCVGDEAEHVQLVVNNQDRTKVHERRVATTNVRSSLIPVRSRSIPV